MLIGLDGKQLTADRTQTGFISTYSQTGAYYSSAWDSLTVVACIRCIADEAKKMMPRHVRGGEFGDVLQDDSINRALAYPNDLMTWPELVEKIVFLLYANSNAFVLPEWDKCDYTLLALWPLMPNTVEFDKDKRGNRVVKMRFGNGYETALAYSSLIHIRYRFGKNDFMGGDLNGQVDYGALLKALRMQNLIDENTLKALKSSQAVNGVIKYKSMMDGGKLEKNVTELLEHLNANESGFLPIDLAAEFIPITKNTKILDSSTLDFVDTKILRYFGISKPMLDGTADAAQRESNYHAVIEPLAVSMGAAFTKGLFTRREIVSFKHRIDMRADQMQFWSAQQKLDFIKQAGSAGLLYDNEIRSIFGLDPIEELNGRRTISLNYMESNAAEDYRLGKVGADNGNSDEGSEAAEEVD